MSLTETIEINNDILKQFNFKPAKQNIITNGMKLEDMFDYMEKASNKIINKSELYQKTSNFETEEDCLDIASEKLNQFTQVFMDIIKYIRIKENCPLDKEDGLIKCCRIYKKLNKTRSDIENGFLEGLSLRNDLTHDYFNYISHRENLIKLLINYSHGSIEICNFLKNYCIKKNMMNDIITKENLNNKKIKPSPEIIDSIDNSNEYDNYTER